MNTYEVVRNGKCMTCGNVSVIFLGEYEAENSVEAVDKALDRWSYDKFGQGGALTESEILEEDSFLEGNFETKIVKE